MNYTSMNSSDLSLFDVYDFDAEVRRLRQERVRNAQTGMRNPFSHVRVASTHSSDDDNDEDDEGMREDEMGDEEAERKYDYQNEMDHAAEALIRMTDSSPVSSPIPSPTPSQSRSQSRSVPVNWHVNEDIPMSPPSSLPSPSPSPSHRLTENMSALDILNLLWGNDLYDHLAQHTNLYAQQKQQQTIDNKWYDVTADEIRAMFGMFVYMSVVKLPSFRDYWSTHPFLSTPIVHNVMSRNRAHKILQYLHANNNNDPLHKIEPILAHLTHSFSSAFQCGKNQCIDELMIAYRGRTHFIQYMPKKSVCDMGSRCGVVLIVNLPLSLSFRSISENNTNQLNNNNKQHMTSSTYLHTTSCINPVISFLTITSLRFIH